MVKKKTMETQQVMLTQTEIGVVKMVGFRSTDRMTVLYMEGGGMHIGVMFKVFVESGKYSNFENSFATELIGKQVKYSYTGMDAMRSPTDAKFVEFVVEN